MNGDKQTRQHTLENGAVITQRRYKPEPWFSYWCHEKCCCFCKKCRSVFYDYMSGPYKFICNEDGDVSKGARGECAQFVEDENADKCPYSIERMIR